MCTCMSLVEDRPVAMQCGCSFIVACYMAGSSTAQPSKRNTASHLRQSVGLLRSQRWPGCEVKGSWCHNRCRAKSGYQQHGLPAGLGIQFMAAACSSTVWCIPFQMQAACLKFLAVCVWLPHADFAYIDDEVCGQGICLACCLPSRSQYSCRLV
jgi:hypothetical protein